MLAAECPPKEELSSYLLGKLPADRLETIADHMDACGHCTQLAEELDAVADGLIAQLRQPLQELEFSGEPQLRRALGQTRSIRPGATVVSSASDAAAGSPPGAPPIIAQRLDDYRLLARVGQGGMGAVYKAVHTRLDKIVAVKLLARNCLGDRSAVARFQREMKAAGKLQHPNIVTAYDAGEANGQHYLVMEFVEGLDLGEVARRAKPLAVADACELVRQAALGLDHAHHYGLVHRDVKPSNLMLSANGAVKILDLGLALLQGDAVEGELTGVQQRMGTADYMSPEQAADSHRLDGRADIYSLGCTLFKLLIGEVPYAGPNYSTAMQKLLAHVNAPAPRPSEHRAELPENLCAIVERMLAKRPEERFQSAADVAAALAPLAAGSDLPALYATAVQRTDGDSPAAALTVTSPAAMSNAAGRIGGKSPPGRRLFAAAGAAAVLLLGVIIIVKMRDGSSRWFKVEGRAESVTANLTDDADTPTASADPNAEVVNWVFEIGGRVAATNQEKWASPGKWPKEPSELPEVFDDLIIHLADSEKVTDADLVRFRSLTKPFSLDLTGTNVTDAGVAALEELPQLHVLKLNGTAITRGGLEGLGVLPNLQIIELAGTDTRGADLAVLANFPKLARLGAGPAHLDLEGTTILSTMPQLNLGLSGVAAADLEHIDRLSYLRTLSISGKTFSDDALERLSGLPQLNALGLWGTSISDAGLARLADASPELTGLSISDCGVTDDGVKHLISLSKLGSLNLYHTRTTSAGVAVLKSALPDCKVNWIGSHGAQ